jgi:hypothetical protein
LSKNYDSVHSQRKDFESLFGPGSVPGYLNGGDVDTAIPLLSKMMPKEGIMVEIGSFLGKSSIEWAKNFQQLDKNFKILCIDSFNSPVEILHDLMQEAGFSIPDPDWDQLELFKFYASGYPNIKPIKTFFNDKFVFPAKVNLVFEDSTHTQKYLATALPFWWDKIHEGGVLAGHDYWIDEVKAAVDLFAALYDLEIKLFDNSSIWYIEKPAFPKKLTHNG